MKRGGPLTRRTPPPTPQQRLRGRRQRRTARDRREAAEERSARLIVRERSGGLCEVDLGACGTEWAHRVRRNVGPWCPSNGLLMCREHHAWCHAHPVDARALGWLLRTTDDPLTTPAVLAFHGAVLLRPDGSLEPYRGPPWP